MHRQISHDDPNFQQESQLSLYLFTGLLGVVLAADLWPMLVGWLGSWGQSLPTWPNEVGGYRLALLAAVLGGARVLYGSLDALFAGRVGADLALAIACVAAILLREPLVAAEVVFIGLVGECLESITFERTQRALRGLVRLRPRRCWRLRNGQEELVRTSELQVGDQIVVKPGGRVPADGVVLDGRSAVDVSALTGESLPVDRGPGDEVLAGALNQFGALTIEARRVAEQTVVGRVVELTSRALKDKAPLERTADRMARYFLPAVLCLALLTFVVALFANTGNWFRSADAPRLGFAAAARISLYPALSVLVVACPCALILATPAAVIAALGRLAGTGLLIKSGSALERLAGVTVFAFDKTGTLTEARLQLGDIVPRPGVTIEELLRIAASAEQGSEHPLARLILGETTRRGLSVERAGEFQAYPGAGVAVQTPSGIVLVGNRRLLDEQGVALPPDVLSQLDHLDASGQTVLLVARAGQVLGLIGARDQVRAEAPEVLAQLRGLGINRMVMLTGDRAAVARSVAAALATAETSVPLEVHAELLPDEKAALISQLRIADCGLRIENHGEPRLTEKVRPGHSALSTPQSAMCGVAMVGDGVNDAVALARADVGLAIAGHMEGGADIAAEAGDVVFMGDPLRPLPLLVRLSRETVSIIRQNILIFAFGVNIAGIVLTAWLWPLLTPAAWYEQSPVVAVIYHQLGSLAVLLNSMRLLWFDRAATSPTYRRLRDGVSHVNRWLEGFNPDEALHWLSHQWKPVLVTLLVLLLAGYALSGLTQVNADEIAIVQRFGEPLPNDLQPGLYWRWPWPIETVTRIQPDRVRTVEIGFRPVPGSTAAPGARAWSSQHGNDGVRRLPDEAVMITGDGNLIELQGTIRYTIRAPRVWLFEVGDGPAILRGAAEAVLRDVVAGRSFSELLTVGRGQFQADVLARLKERIQDYGPEGLGVRLEGVSLHDLHPPQEVVQAYHQVTKAMEQRDRRINDAQADALTQVERQKSRKQETITLAEAAANKRVRQAQAETAAFLARYQARTQLDLGTEWDLLLPSIQGLLANDAPESIVADYRKRRADALALRAKLTDFRLYWDALAGALSGRDKVIVDADKVPGRRHLWLVPFEMFPLAPVMPQDRSGRGP
jgi:Cu+-exporting ATPase